MAALGAMLLFHNTQILANSFSHDIRLMRESLEISLKMDAINKDGARLSDPWLPLLEILEKAQIRTVSLREQSQLKHIGRRRVAGTRASC